MARSRPAARALGPARAGQLSAVGNRRCPYCAEAIEPVAIACPHRTRDLWFAKPLMDGIEALSDRVAVLEASVTAIAKARETDPGSPPASTSVSAAPGRAGSIRWAVPLAVVLALVAAHAVLIVLLDARLVYLRLLSIGMPFAAGLVFRKGAARFVWIDVLVALAVACLAVAGMLWTVAHADGVPILPAGRQEWGETLQYGSSIALGFISGALVRRVVLMATLPDESGGVMTRLARAVAKDIAGNVEDASFEKRLKKIESLITSGVAIGAAILSGLLGLSRVLS